jgi:hypothetical protein
VTTLGEIIIGFFDTPLLAAGFFILHDLRHRSTGTRDGRIVKKLQQDCFEEFHGYHEIYVLDGIRQQLLLGITKALKTSVGRTKKGARNDSLPL